MSEFASGTDHAVTASVTLTIEIKFDVRADSDGEVVKISSVESDWFEKEVNKIIAARNNTGVAKLNIKIN